MAKKTVYILGMHRSGTSLLGKILTDLGVFLGEDSELLPPSEFNLLGYYEAKEITRINEALLSEREMAWDKVKLEKLNSKYLSSPKIKKLADEAKNFIASLHNKSSVIGLKDPRLCLTLPIWEDSKANKQYVFIFRDPFEVANSLKRRNNFDTKKSLELYKKYNQKCMEYLNGKEFLMIDYSSLVKDPHNNIIRLDNYLNLNQSNGILIKASSNIIPSLNHSTINSVDKELTGEEETYNLLVSRYHTNLKDFPLKKNLKYKTINKDIVYNNDVANFDRILLLKNEQLKSERQDFENKMQRHIKKLEKMNKIIENLIAKIDEKDQVIQKLKIRNKRLTRENSDLNEEMNVFDSLSWRVFSGVKRTLGPFVKIIRKFNNLLKRS